MMHVRFSQLTADPQVLAGCVRYIERSVRPVLASLHGSLGLSLLGRAESGVAIFESFWATHDAVYLSEETEARCRGELARRIGRPVTAEDYQVPVFERQGPLAGGEAARLTRIEVKPAGVQDVIDVFGDTAVPRLAESPGFCGALLFAAPASGQLMSETMWRDAQSRSASPNVAEMIRAEVLAEAHCEIRAVEDYALVFSSARKPSVPA